MDFNASKHSAFVSFPSHRDCSSDSKVLVFSCGKKKSGSSKNVRVRAVEILIKVFANVDYLFVGGDESAVIACFQLIYCLLFAVPFL